MICQGDLSDVLPTLGAESIDACATDPPYELAFMGRAWDRNGVAFRPETWRLVYRVLKPGAHLVAFGGTRTFHRLTCAIEDAGFEIRDCLSWLYGQGFPKSLNLAVAFDKLAGMPSRSKRITVAGYTNDTDMTGGEHPAHQATSDLGCQWQGWGTALKPGWEPIVLARKPLVGTVAANVQRYGTGALNIDGCRIDTQGETWERESGTVKPNVSIGTFQTGARSVVQHDLGRWPANVILDEEAAAMLNEMTGELTSGDWPKLNRNSDKLRNTYGRFQGSRMENGRPAESGGASRFFYCPKASREERNFGCSQLEALAPQGVHPGLVNTTAKSGVQQRFRRRNTHPTVKPVELMRWLVKLVTPLSGIVLDPFMGSGTTGMACRYEQRQFIGIEREAEYVAIAERRIAAVAPLFANQEEFPDADETDSLGDDGGE